MKQMDTSSCAYISHTNGLICQNVVIFFKFVSDIVLGAEPFVGVSGVSPRENFLILNAIWRTLVM